MSNDHEGILRRIERLERQNRRMKLAGLGALVIAGAFLLMGQASGPHTLPEVRANSFVLVDAQGKQRATLDIIMDQPRLALSDTNGTIRAALAISLGGPALVLVGSNGSAAASLAVQPDGPLLDMLGANSMQAVTLEIPTHGPELKLNDANGFETAIGATDLITPTTGETQTTSAASLVLFGKDKKVLWSAPPQN